MASSSSFDYSDLTRLAADLSDVPREVVPKLAAALSKTAFDVKKDAQASVRTSPHFRAAAAAISYDNVTHDRVGDADVSVEVGYDKGRAAGALGNLREYGAPDAKYGGKSVPLAPSYDLRNALEKNAPDFERGIEIAIRDAEREAGL